MEKELNHMLDRTEQDTEIFHPETICPRRCKSRKRTEKQTGNKKPNRSHAESYGRISFHDFALCDRFDGRIIAFRAKTVNLGFGTKLILIDFVPK